MHDSTLRRPHLRLVPHTPSDGWVEELSDEPPDEITTPLLERVVPHKTSPNFQPKDQQLLHFQPCVSSPRKPPCLALLAKHTQETFRWSTGLESLLTRRTPATAESALVGEPCEPLQDLRGRLSKLYCMKQQQQQQQQPSPSFMTFLSDTTSFTPLQASPLVLFPWPRQAQTTAA
ncbi:hypothetical protein E2C01_057631 [Portunus trituberculatus]|uniref:Uncharacterized protein n=1 Tax=Portunus trituberculatus TaxID=210409 RepID=A0A5B7H0J4_PORTR|nr:hypothetical protein [Portunus trituberculatus]